MPRMFEVTDPDIKKAADKLEKELVRKAKEHSLNEAEREALIAVMEVFLPKVLGVLTELLSAAHREGANIGEFLEGMSHRAEYIKRQIEEDSERWIFRDFDVQPRRELMMKTLKEVDFNAFVSTSASRIASQLGLIRIS